jgi:hypothetical protein
MIRRILLLLLLLLLITSCGGAAPATQAPAATELPPTEAAATGPPAATEAPPTEEPAATEPPSFQSLEAPTRTASQGQPTATLSPASTQIVSTLTDTPLPTLELPTEVVNAPDKMVWDGTPTYLAESTPGYAFRVSYDPEVWALTTDQFGFPALGHRTIPGCVISVTSGRGLPPNLTVEHDVWDTGDAVFDVGNVFENGALKFITYTGGNANIITGFQLSFEEQPDDCRAHAIAVLATLTAVRSSQATPTPTP